MSLPAKTITITSLHTAVLLRSVATDIAQCQHHVDQLKKTGSEHTPLATYWRAQLEAAQQLHELVSKTPFEGVTVLPFPASS